MSRQRVLTMVLFAASLFAGWAVSSASPFADAHSQSLYYDHKWGTGVSDVQIGAGGPLTAIDPATFPTSASAATQMRADANNAGNAWDNVSSASNWSSFSNGNVYDSAVVYKTDPCDSSYYSSSIEVWLHATPLSGQIGNQTECEFVFGGAPLIFKSNIRFDTSSRTWSFGDATPPSGSSSFRGVATHELGHSTGFDEHFTRPTTFISGQACWPSANAGDATMCSGITSNGAYKRTLEDHDVHTFQNAY